MAQVKLKEPNASDHRLMAGYVADFHQDDEGESDEEEERSEKGEYQASSCGTFDR